MKCLKNSPFARTGKSSLFETHRNSNIFAGILDEGAFRATDNGDTWSPINTGLTNTIVRAFAINSNGDIFAGTGGGVFRSVESTTAVEEISSSIPASFALEQNYPNPFNPTTIIRYQLSESSDVELTIYNQLGQRVKTLVTETQPVGMYQTEWNGQNEMGRRVSSGIYFYRLNAGSFSETRKMSLLR